MAISGKTRKRLWAKSGGLCAICKTKVLKELKAAELIGVRLHFSYLTRDRIRKSVRAFLMIEKKSKAQLFFRSS